MNAEETIIISTDKNIGFNAETNSVEDLFAAGVKDSARALKIALELAAENAEELLKIGSWASELSS